MTNLANRIRLGDNTVSAPEVAEELDRLTSRVADLEQQLRYWEQRAMGAGHG